MIIISFFFNIIGILIPSFLARTVWRHWHLPVSLPLTMFMFVVVSICILNLFGLSTFASGFVFHINVTLFIGFTTTALWFWLTYEFITKKKLSKKKLLLISIEPVLMVIISITNEQHGMYASSVQDIARVGYEFKIFRLLHIIYSLGLIIFSISWLVYHLYQYSSRKIYQLLLLVVVLSLPTLSFLMYVFGMLPVRIGAPLSIVLILLGVYRFKMLDIIPIARGQIVDHINDGVAVINCKGLLVDANTTASILLDIPMIYGSGMKQTIKSPQRIARIEQAFDLKSMQVQYQEMAFDTQASHIESADVLLTPILDKNQRPIGNLLFIRDITAHKQAMLDREFHIRKIEQSRQKLQKLDQFKSDFLANISHEFRTPLTLSLGAANDICAGMYGNVSRGIESQLKLISKHNQRLLDLINQLLELSYLESVKKVENKKTIDWVKYIPKLMAGFEGIAQKNEIKLIFETKLTTALVNMQADNTEKIINNLLSNALKYSNKNGQIKIKLTAIENNKIQLQIIDTGNGISQQSLPHIFERFYHSNQKHSQWSAGTGIGLALVKQIVENHGGQISVNSHIDKGSIFTIVLKKNQLNESIAIDKTNTQNSDVGHKDKPLVLIIDDNKDMRDYLSSHLNKYRLMEAQDGQQGLDKAIAYIPDLIVSDIMMPVRDGYDLCRTIKNTVQISHIPIILLTARSDPNDKLAGLKAEADAYLSKPFNTEELKARIHNLLKQRQKLGNYYSQFLSEQLPKEKGANEIEQLKINSKIEVEYLLKLQKHMYRHIAFADLQTKDLAADMCTSERQLQRKLKALTGKTPIQWMLQIRLQLAARLLKESNLNITQVVEKSGFNSSSYFAKKFKQYYKKSPTSFRLTSSGGNVL